MEGFAVEFESAMSSDGSAAVAVMATSPDGSLSAANAFATDSVTGWWGTLVSVSHLEGSGRWVTGITSTGSSGEDMAGDGASSDVDGFSSMEEDVAVRLVTVEATVSRRSLVATGGVHVWAGAVWEVHCE